VNARPTSHNNGREPIQKGTGVSDSTFYPHQFVRGLAALNGHLHAIDAACDNWNTPLSSSELLADSMTYNLRGCIWALQRLGAFIRRGAQNQPPRPGEVRSIAWDQSFEAHSAIDYFLACGRRTQDLLVEYIGKVLRKQLPGSMNDLLKKIEQRELGAMTTIVIDYWKSHGARLRDYRVLSQHHGQIATDCRFYADPSGALHFFCGLPSNPAEKAARSLVWEPAVDAYPYLRAELAALLSVVRDVVRVLLQNVGGTGMAQGGFVYSFRAPLDFDQTGSPIPLDSDVEDLLKSLV
jgi:hypothetical protein